MQKSHVIDLKNALSYINNQNDNEYFQSYVSDSFNSEEEDFNKAFENLDRYQPIFQNLNFNETIPIYQNDTKVDDYEHKIIDNQFEIQGIEKPQRAHVECVLSMVSSVENFPVADSSYEQMFPPIYMWKHTTKLLPSKFEEFVQSYFRENYSKIYQRLRFFCQVSPNDDKINKISTIRKTEIAKERILFHHIGYGFPTLEQTSIPCFDKKLGIFHNYPIIDLFKSIQTPSFYVFDCSNAGLALHALHIASISCNKSKINSILTKQQLKTIDWNDYYCLCASDINENLPACPYLPRDFLTSCIFTPVKIAIICHILQYYRTTLVTEKFPMDRFTQISDIENANLNNSLQAIIEAIAVDNINVKLYRELFRTDAITATLFRQFILAQFLLRPYQVHPVSNPALPDLSYNYLWNDWKNIVDCYLTRLTADSFGFINNVFYNSVDSVTEQLKNNSENNISQGLISLIFHLPSIGDDFTFLSYRILAEYASKSQKCRNILAKIVPFSFLFSNLTQKNSKELTHHLCYLYLSIIQVNPNLIYEINPKDDLFNLTDLLYNDEISNITKSMIAATLSSVLFVNEPLHILVTSKKFLLCLKHLLEEDDSLLNLWILILFNRIFDFYGVDKVIYENGIHIQIALFCFHNSHEVRASSLSILPFFIQSNESINIQMFLLSFQTTFDASFLVRYNYVLFLNKLISKKYKKITLSDFEGKRNSLNLLINKYICDNYNYKEVTSKEIIIESINKFLENKDATENLYEILLSLIDLYHFDPHPSIRKYIDQMLNQNELTENGGEAVLKISLFQLVNSGQWKCENKIESFRKPISLPPPSLTTIPTTKLVKTVKYKFESEIPTHLSYDSKTLSISLSTSKGNVYYFDENYKNKSKLYIDSNITSLSISDWEYQPLIFIGTDDGCINVWNPSNSKQKICFRDDIETNVKLPTVLSLFNSKKQFVSSRGRSGRIRLWDVEYQKLICEWNAGAKETVTAIATHPLSSDLCVAGFSNGLIVEMDLRSGELHNIAAPLPNEKIIKIVGNVRSDNSISFIAGTQNSSCIIWEDLFRCSILKLDTNSSLNDFDAHQHSPLIALSTTKSYPVLADYNGSIIHSFKEAGTNAVCSFHPVLPNIMCGSTTGELIEYQLTT